MEEILPSDVIVATKCKPPDFLYFGNKHHMHLVNLDKHGKKLYELDEESGEAKFLLECKTGFIPRYSNRNIDKYSYCKFDDDSQKWVWSEPTFECLQNLCRPLTDPDHGRWTYPSGRGFGKHAFLICKEGYKLPGTHENSALCLDGYWNLLNIGTCQPIKCADLEDPVDGTVSKKTGLGYGDRVTYTCTPGYRLVGDETRHCNADGSWTGKMPDCLKFLCKNPSNHPNAEVELVSGLRVGNIARFTCRHDPKISVESTCTYDSNSKKFEWIPKPPVCPKGPSERDSVSEQEDGEDVVAPSNDNGAPLEEAEHVVVPPNDNGVPLEEAKETLPSAEVENSVTPTPGGRAMPSAETGKKTKNSFDPFFIFLGFSLTWVTLFLAWVWYGVTYFLTI